MLEDIVTEFDIQGLEIDYSVMAWDADFRYENGAWTYNRLPLKTHRRTNRRCFFRHSSQKFFV